MVEQDNRLAEQCPKCKGHRRQGYYEDGNGELHIKTCPICHGTGEKPDYLKISHEANMKYGAKSVDGELRKDIAEILDRYTPGTFVNATLYGKEATISQLQTLIDIAVKAERERIITKLFKYKRPIMGGWVGDPAVTFTMKESDLKSLEQGQSLKELEGEKC